jgi:indolepyruvate ferredoxin oxidoreductase beta subunit
MIYNILLVGTGGQGIITISNILAAAALATNLRVIVTQKKGLAQRGGSVVAQVRIGEVYSPQIPKFSSDSIFSMDINETFKYIDYINKDTRLVVNSKLNGNKDDSHLSEKERTQREKIEQLKKILKDNLLLVDADSIAKEKRMDRSANLFLLGVLFSLDSRINSLLTKDDIVDSIKKNISRNIDSNLQIFVEGIEFLKSDKL